MNNILKLIGRDKELFDEDISVNSKILNEVVSNSNFLVLGGAGSIGQSVTKEIFKRNPRKLHVVDISENNLVELVRDIRSSLGHIDGEFKTFALDIGSVEYDAFISKDGIYNFVLNLSALKHVRSEEDPFTLMRLIDVNIFNTIKTINQSVEKGVQKYFCVSTDKAANPVNMMGASKRIMEMFLKREGFNIKISTARFANVAFSDGSLLNGFDNRLEKNQPIAAPSDVMRYFITPKEAGELCLMSCILGENQDIMFPKLSDQLKLISLSEIAKSYLTLKGYEHYPCADENEARLLVSKLLPQRKWPCLFLPTSTTGEKSFEEFYTSKEIVDMNSYLSIGLIKNNHDLDLDLLSNFESAILKIKAQAYWDKQEIIDQFKLLLHEFDHKETMKYLDSKM